MSQIRIRLLGATSLCESVSLAVPVQRPGLTMRILASLILGIHHPVSSTATPACHG